MKLLVRYDQPGAKPTVILEFEDLRDANKFASEIPALIMTAKVNREHYIDPMTGSFRITLNVTEAVLAMPQAAQKT